MIFLYILIFSNVLINVQNVHCLDSDLTFEDTLAPELSINSVKVTNNQDLFHEEEHSNKFIQEWLYGSVKKLHRSIRNIFSTEEADKQVKDVKRSLDYSPRRKRDNEYQVEGSGNEQYSYLDSYHIYININEAWTVKFSDRESFEFKKLDQTLKTGLNTIFEKSIGYNSDDHEDLHFVLISVSPVANEQFSIEVVVLVKLSENNYMNFKQLVEQEVGAYAVLNGHGLWINEVKFVSIVECKNDEFQCSNGECISKSKLCDDHPDCVNGEDELDCTCSYDKWQCDDGTCIPIILKCNTNIDCPNDISDERFCNDRNNASVYCQPGEFQCDDICQPSTIICNGVVDCSNEEDERDCPNNNQYDPPTYDYCPENRCPSGNCYFYKEKCDGTADCEDGSDEENCPENDYKCGSDDFTCHSGSCIPKVYMCNGVADCNDGSDEYNCTAENSNQNTAFNCQPYQFKCRNNQCISAYAKCDGRSDCSDHSDELNCGGVTDSPHPEIRLQTYPANQKINEGLEVVFRCRDEGPNRVDVRWVRPGGRQLPIGAMDKNGRLEIPNIRMDDSGEYICEAIGYPSYIGGQSTSVSLTVEKNNLIYQNPTTKCPFNQSTCFNGHECIDKHTICDGIPHCSDGSDEESCSINQKCQPNQFMCKNMKCVARFWRCDGENDCGDYSDEQSCDQQPAPGPCRFDEFQCSSGHCILKSFHCDSTNDCSDGSDEIGCHAPSVIRTPPSTVSLQVGDTLNITCHVTGTPTPIIVWRLNWGRVRDTCRSTSHNGLGHLICENMEVRDSGAYTCEALNSQGNILVTPDTYVTVSSNGAVCPRGTFNDFASNPRECVNCFCFGVTTECASNSPRGSDIYINYPRTIFVLDPSRNEFTESHQDDAVESYNGIVKFSPKGFQESNVYLSLGSDLSSTGLGLFGGNLRYNILIDGRIYPSDDADVVLIGKRYNLHYKSPTDLQSNIQNSINVQFYPDNWKKSNGQSVTREEMMMTLAELSNVLIKLIYDRYQEQSTVDSIIFNAPNESSESTLIEKCSCPIGYTGSSCESCSPGYVRQRGGRWLGQCVPDQPECPSGTYGNLLLGIPCKPCPCPLTDNNFSSGCSLNDYGEVICNCNTGYTGRRCEYCASGYVGNPNVPGGRCEKKRASPCNEIGTQSHNSDGTCTCKPNVVGRFCESCEPQSFHLNSNIETGCIPCFCMGISTECTSSSLYRDSVFLKEDSLHEVGLLNQVHSRRYTPISFSANIRGKELTHLSHSNENDLLYWSMPIKFLQNKLTAYGGNLTYTLRYKPIPGGQMSKNAAADVIIKSKNAIEIQHFRKSKVDPGVSSTYSVPLFEHYWQRRDRESVDRTHMLMLLSSIEAIYVKATYTTSTSEIALTEVSMDIGTEGYTGRNNAYEVEQCSCPREYTGLSCENCAPGYSRTSEAGTYLGYCEECNCNGHSSDCDSETGVCTDCQHNTMGENCEECLPGFVKAQGNSNNIICQPSSYEHEHETPLDCPSGYVQYPDPSNRGQYLCRPYYDSSNQERNCQHNTIGPNCEDCLPGFIKTRDHSNNIVCQSESEHEYEAPLECPSGYVKQPDPSNRRKYTCRPYYDSSHQERNCEHNTMGENCEDCLPGFIKTRDHSNNIVCQLESEPEYETPMECPSGYVRYPDPSNRRKYVCRPYYESSNQERNCEHNTMGENCEDCLPGFLKTRDHLNNIVCQSETEPESEYETPLECPSGYVKYPDPSNRRQYVCRPYYESSNEERLCENLYYRNTSGSCQPCPMRDNVNSCSMNYDGSISYECASGFSGHGCRYRDEVGSSLIITFNSPKTVTVHAGENFNVNCMTTADSNINKDTVNFDWYKTEGTISPSAVQRQGQLILYNVRPEDSGSYVCEASRGRINVKDTLTITVIDTTYNEPQNTITIEPSEVKEIPGSNIQLVCKSQSASHFKYSWSKDNDVLKHSSKLFLYDNILYITNAVSEDSGTYVCSASDRLNKYVSYAQVIIAPENSESMLTLPQIQPMEQYHNVIQGKDYEIQCSASGYPTPTVRWTKLHDSIGSNVFPVGNKLQIKNAQRSNRGHYVCIAENEKGSDEITIGIDVDPREVPVISISPNNSLTISPGGSGALICRKVAGIPTPTMIWRRTDGKEIPRNFVEVLPGYLVISDFSAENAGTYECFAENIAGSISAEVNLKYLDQSLPVVYFEPNQRSLDVTEGDDVEIYCRGDGEPYPRVSFKNVDSKRAIEEQGVAESTLYISRVTKNDAGTYTCKAENDVGDVEEHITLNVKSRRGDTGISDIEGHLYETSYNAYVGEFVKVTCEITGSEHSSPVHPVWKRVHGYDLPPYAKSVGKELIFERIDTDATGDYICKDQYSSVPFLLTTLNVKPNLSPVISLQPSMPIEVTSGENIKIICNVQGEQPITVKWQMEDVDVLPRTIHTDGNVLQFNQITPDNAGKYTCLASNRYGDSKQMAEVVVLQNRYEITEISESQGSSFALTCGDNYNSSQYTFKWRRHNMEPLPTNSRFMENKLLIHNLNERDVGRYFCVVLSQNNNVVGHRAIDVKIKREYGFW